MRKTMSRLIPSDITATNLSPLPAQFKPTVQTPHTYSTDSNRPKKLNASRLRASPSTPPQRKPRSPVSILPHTSLGLSPTMDRSLSSPPPISPLITTSTVHVPPPPPADVKLAARGSHWSFVEKARFEAALLRHGQFTWSAIVEAVGTRSEKQVKAYAARYRRRRKLAARAEMDALRDNMAAAAQACALASAVPSASPPSPSLTRSPVPELRQCRPPNTTTSTSTVSTSTSPTPGYTAYTSSSYSSPVVIKMQPQDAVVSDISPSTSSTTPAHSNHGPLRPVFKSEPTITTPDLPLMSYGTGLTEFGQQTSASPVLGLGVLPDGEECEGLLEPTDALVADELVTSSSSGSFTDVGDDPLPRDPFSALF